MCCNWSWFKALFWCKEANVNDLLQMGSCDYGSCEEVPDGPVLSRADAVTPIEVGGSFEEVVGPISSTMLDGPAVALDSGSAFSGLVEIRKIGRASCRERV